MWGATLPSSLARVRIASTRYSEIIAWLGELRKVGIERVDVGLVDGKPFYLVRGSFEGALVGRVRKALAPQAQIDSLDASWATIETWKAQAGRLGGPEAFPELEGEVRDDNAVGVRGTR
jgi:hypothetical protein